MIRTLKYSIKQSITALIHVSKINQRISLRTPFASASAKSRKFSHKAANATSPALLMLLATQITISMSTLNARFVFFISILCTRI